MQSVTILDQLIKGFIIGIVVSAPMGPVGILTIQRTLNKGRWEGLATGVGASASDFLYAIVTGYGMSFIVDIIEDPSIAILIKLVGSILLFIFGIFTFRSSPKKPSGRDVVLEMPVGHSERMKLLPYAMSGFAVTVSNPLIIFLFLVLFGQFTFILSNNWIPQIVGYVFIVVGALSWWFGLTWLVYKVRTRFNQHVIWWINRIIGIIVMVVSAVIIISTLTGHSIGFQLEP